MRYLELDDDDHVVLDVGHSGGVTSLAVTPDAVLSGGDDGYVYARDLDGASLVPPAHLPEVTTVVFLGGTTCVVGTVGHTYGFDITTGDHRPLAGLEDTWVGAGVELAGRAVLGCGDGSVRTLAFGEGVRPFASLTAPIKGMARDGDDGIAVCTVDGTLTYLDTEGDVRWQVSLMPGEVESVTCRDGTVVVGGASPTPGMGQVIAFDLDGQETHRVGVAAPVAALAAAPDAVAVAIGDGTVHRLGDDLVDVGTVGTVQGLGVESLAVGDGEIWYGTADGRVGRLDPPRELPAVSSGVLALTIRSDEEAAVGSDGRRLLTYDLRSGDVTAETELEAVIALTYAGPDTDDLVVAYPDGRLERRRGPGHGEVLAEGRVDFRPTALGLVDGLVVAEDEESYTAVAADDLSPAELDAERFDDVAIVRRTGFAFTGHGPLVAVDVAVIDSTELVVARPGLVGVTDGAATWLRVWSDDGWAELVG